MTWIAFGLLVAFSICILVCFLIVRTGKLHMWSTLGVGSIFNTSIVFLFSIVRGNHPTHALFVGLLLGVFFTALSTAFGQFFYRIEITYVMRAIEMLTSNRNNTC